MSMQLSDEIGPITDGNGVAVLNRDMIIGMLQAGEAICAENAGFDQTEAFLLWVGFEEVVVLDKEPVHGSSQRAAVRRQDDTWGIVVVDDECSGLNYLLRSAVYGSLRDIASGQRLAP